MIPCVAYMRCSGMGQNDGDTWDRQWNAIVDYARSKGLTIVKAFREVGVSGTKDLIDRPSLSELFTYVREEGIQTVLIERVDRLARDLLIQETIIADMMRSQVEILSVGEPDLCSNDPSRKLVRQIFGAIAEFDRAMTVLKLRGARQRMKSKVGRCEGQKPYGSKPEEVWGLDLILRHHAAGETARRISETLNGLGGKTRSGKPWHPSTVAKIIARQNSAISFQNT